MLLESRLSCANHSCNELSPTHNGYFGCTRNNPLFDCCAVGRSDSFIVVSVRTRSHDARLWAGLGSQNLQKALRVGCLSIQINPGKHGIWIPCRTSSWRQMVPPIVGLESYSSETQWTNHEILVYCDMVLEIHVAKSSNYTAFPARHLSAAGSEIGIRERSTLPSSNWHHSWINDVHATYWMLQQLHQCASVWYTLETRDTHETRASRGLRFQPCNTLITTSNWRHFLYF